MRVITTTVIPDFVPERMVDWANSPVIGPEAFAITSAWLPRDLEGLPGPWERIFQSMHHLVAEVLGQEFSTHQLSDNDLLYQGLVPSTDELSRAIQHYCDDTKGWVSHQPKLYKRPQSHGPTSD